MGRFQMTGEDQADAIRRSNAVEEMRLNVSACDRSPLPPVTNKDSVSELVDRIEELDRADSAAHACLLAAFQQIVEILREEWCSSKIPKAAAIAQWNQ